MAIWLHENRDHQNATGSLPMRTDIYNSELFIALDFTVLLLTTKMEDHS